MSYNGADALADVLIENGIKVCFSNPGTTEMHLVAALTRDGRIANHLCLFEGVATGAADGYARMSGRPAATLLHLGPGLANGLANLHNARKAAMPVLNIVGEHAVAHIAHDAPLTSDIAGLAGPVSKTVATLTEPADIARVTGDLLRDIQSGVKGIGTLIMPNDVAWSEAAPDNQPAIEIPSLDAPDPAAVSQAAKALQTPGAYLLLGAPHITRRMQELAQAIAAKTGATLLAEAATARCSRGGGLPGLARIPFQIDAAIATLEGAKQAVLAGARAPVAFFAYPERPSALLPETCEITTLCPAEADVETALSVLADELDASIAEPQKLALPPIPTGPITPEALGAAVANGLPENAIVADESVTNGTSLYPACASAPAHDWLNNRGGSIGYGMPLAIGCAAACPNRPVLAVIGDGSASYTLQALWTMARAGMNITVLILSNRRYKILSNEMSKIGAGEPDENSDPLMDLGNPSIGWVALAEGYGVAARQVSEATELRKAISLAMATPGPFLIEAVM
ncbi:acetolactate synthase large subunit [Alisedimentitalea sp. MJ-SS2]|uniref:acetolactate synthase large subunit n=1 Tax=Aliisedimentitalea sp. MJ-SS2 TaxID=3049795 RepID=UPI0029090205|nr:acetolactate synthase large subunit [Alisedimentitalea sp. MJ-SS2]MDU8926185.1 acetolactate synthase large subunit [Alisedimentitalea sp. MJ-SS2]